MAREGLRIRAMSKTYESWGGYPRRVQKAVRLDWKDARLPALDEGETFLPYGSGRSYGDQCLNTGGVLLDTRGLKRFVKFDTETGIMVAEAGVTLAEILDICVPKGWLLPVIPGTRLITLGGAIANDVHGKNHHAKHAWGGSFGHHVRKLWLRRSDGEDVVCSPDKKPEWFAATVAGMGLTGVIVQAEIQLMPITSGSVAVRTIKQRNLEHFFDLCAEFDESHDYTVSWFDDTCIDGKVGRGVFMAGRLMNADERGALPLRAPGGVKLSIPFSPPVAVINPLTIGGFNSAYRLLPRRERSVVPLAKFFNPLDGIGNWRGLYGPNGFVQFQCVLPKDEAASVVPALLKDAREDGHRSFLNVLKMFGDRPSAGMLSFPRPGITLTLDFPFMGERTVRLLHKLEDRVMDADGALYPAKDACMRAKSFKHAYPLWQEFADFADPAISSDLWRRVSGLNGGRE